jgi:16S rRNA (adenine1518-N6/adenine1519-N6)-dimethyltransferase
MIYNNKQELLAMLKKNGLWLNKSLGQNFLINTHIIDQTLEAAEINDNDYIVEVGPGMGILTNELARRAKKVTTVEFDSSIIPTLENNIREHKNITIINMDALKLPLPADKYKLVANIPYYITSPLLNHFLNPAPAGADRPNIGADAGAPAETGRPEQRRPSLIVLLVQKEVADKVCSTAGDHSVLSLEVQLFGKPHVENKVGRSSFFPEPKVDSAILKIKTYPEPLIEDTETFFRLIKAAFNQKRKTLNNSLKNGLRLTKEQIEEIFKNAGLDLAARPQSLEIEDWKKLVEEYKKVCQN